ncbi:MAG: calcium-binding protein [Pseudomonadota bacterium]
MKETLENATGFAADLREQQLRDHVNNTISIARKDGVISDEEQEAIDKAMDKLGFMEALNNELNTPNSANTTMDISEDFDPRTGHNPNSMNPDNVTAPTRPGFELNGLDALAEQKEHLDQVNNPNKEFKKGVGVSRVRDDKDDVDDTASDPDIGPETRGFGKDHSKAGEHSSGNKSGASNDDSGGSSDEGSGKSGGDSGKSGGSPGNSGGDTGKSGGDTGKSGGGTSGKSGGDSGKSGGPSNDSGSNDPGDRGHDGHGGAMVPILLDLDGDGIQITEFSKSTVFMDGSGDGLVQKTAWAGMGDGVLFYDPDNLNKIVEARQFVFTEWDPTATSDMEALRSVFDSNGDGVFDANDDAFSDFKVLVTNPDGSLTAVSLTALGIASIDLTADATNIEFPDGSVITGQTTFTWTDGTTGIVADTTLAADDQGYRVEETETTDASGNRVATTKAYDLSGSLVMSVQSVVSPDGSSVVNNYDDNGDEVVDRYQTIDTVTNPDGSETETVTNWVGGDLATAILDSRTVTTTSADGGTVTIERDSTGGGWFDQVETWTTHPDGSKTIVITELSDDGSVIRSITETVSADGLIRSEQIDADGDGSIDVINDHSIVINGDGSRVESIVTKNGDGSIRSSVTETVSADGRSKTIARDLDGDGDTDTLEDLEIVVGPVGTTSTLDVLNGDGSLRSSVIDVQSDDALTSTRSVDADGDGVFETTVLDQTINNADGSRSNTVTVTNADGSVRSMVQENLGADRVTSETWVDLNQNGAFEASDLVRSVTIDAATQNRISQTWDRNADGSVNSTMTATTSADGLVTTTIIDEDGDTDTDTEISDVTIVNGDGSTTTTVSTYNQDGTLRNQYTTDVSADGLTTETTFDEDGDGELEGQSVVTSSVATDGTVTRSVSDYAGDGTTLLYHRVSTESDDRRTITVEEDSDGDGVFDYVRNSVEALDGAQTVTETNFHQDGSVRNAETISISANGLEVTTTQDFDGDGQVDLQVMDVTALNADGSRTQSIEMRNGDGSLRDQMIETVSDDGLTITTRFDADGDGVFERETVSERVLEDDGSQSLTDSTYAGNGTLTSQAVTTVSDDGQVTTTQYDRDADGVFDFSTETATTVLNDGTTSTTVKTLEADGTVRDQSTTTVSDDGRLVVTTTDVNGDGQTNSVYSLAIADDGLATSDLQNLNADGSLQNRFQTVSSADGLSETDLEDRDGDGTFEVSFQATSVYQADGSITTTNRGIAGDGTEFSRSVSTISDDGLSSTTYFDLDGDGVFEQENTSNVSLSVNGVETVTSQSFAADGSLLFNSETVTSADGRTETESVDVDGDGSNDRVYTRVEAADGDVSTTTSLFSSGGTLVSQFETEVSGDGLKRIDTVDRNGDGRAELISTDVTSLETTGYQVRTVTHDNYLNVVLAQEEYILSDDGLRELSQLDFDGDGVFEFQSEDLTVLGLDGSVTRTQTTLNESFETQSFIETTTSADGLVTLTDTDYSGDGVSDRLNTVTLGADGSFHQVVSEYGVGSSLTRETSLQISADDLSSFMSTDLDGDGFVDQTMSLTTDTNLTVSTTYQSLDLSGDATQSITSMVSANEHIASFAFDLDADGTVDVSRETVVTYSASGDEIVTFSEVYPTGQVSFQEVTTTSANGFSQTTTIDYGGDGVDITEQSDTVIHDDGSTTTTTVSTYADGSIHRSFVEEVSADGRSRTETLDYDGNGVPDLVREFTIEANGSEVLVETSFNEAGVEIAQAIITTSADGLTTTITQDDTQQTITRSPIDNGSYTWDNGGNISAGETHYLAEHIVDSFGVETWTLTETTSATGTPAIYEVRLDTVAKARLIDEAAKIFDVVFDRGMATSELERLVLDVQEGELEQSALATRLQGSVEFNTRYGTMSDSEFIQQIYENGLGRGPSLHELNDHLSALADASATRVDLIVDLSESVEKDLVGNGQGDSNNFNTPMNPAVFERATDEAQVATLIDDLFDTVYDREATAQEISYHSERLLEGTETLTDIADSLLALSGETHGVATNSLVSLNDTDFVLQAFLNALGRPPIPDEHGAWAAHLAQGNITRGEFLASLALSVDHQAASGTYLATLTDNPTQVTDGVTTGGWTYISGTSGQDAMTGTGQSDVITGLGGSDELVGGLGVDSLDGGVGSDTYVWSRGDGDDIIHDTSASLTETDTLVLTDVSSSEVTLTRVAGSYDFTISVNGTGGAALSVVSQYYTTWPWFPEFGYGIEQIEFADGVVWTLDDIHAATLVNGTASAENLQGSIHADNLLGGDGADTISGHNGDDTITGGTGNDTLDGQVGSDTYIWSRGDGDDTVSDTSASLTEVDTLVLTDVASSEVTLTRATGSTALEITIAGTGGATLTVTSQYYAMAPNFEFQGHGLERIEFSDGVVWTLNDILAATQVIGTAGLDNLQGTIYDDNLLGEDGADVITGSWGDDTLTGGTGNDTLDGQIGNDTYVWSRGDGDDRISDSSADLTEVDTLVLTDVASSEVTLTRTQGSYDLVITVNGTGGAALTVASQYYTTWPWFPEFGHGIEQIEFGDGVVWTLDDIHGATQINGTVAAETLNGSIYADNLFGDAGADVITGHNGNDVLVGGAGHDTLNGENGHDTFIWSKGDGNDRLSDTGLALDDVDTLKLQDVASTDANLTQVGNDLQIEIISTGEIITVVSRFYSASQNYGVEYIEFSDGVVVEVLSDPVAQSVVTGTGGNDLLQGWGFTDTILGEAGNDTLYGGGGNDHLTGGVGVDVLSGQAGSDTYTWSRGDCDDRIQDGSASLTEVDTLVLTDVASSEVSLTRANGSSDLVITIGETGGATLTVVSQYYTLAPLFSQYGYGLERIEFSDGVVWTLDDILAATQVNGTAGADNLQGSIYDDNLFGEDGADVLSASWGNDVLTGGTGNDTLDGQLGNDAYVWSRGDGDDQIQDTSASLAEVDTLVLTDVASSEVTLTRATGSTNLVITIAGTGGATLTVVSQYYSVWPTFELQGHGLERIEFSDGVVWTLDDILAATQVNGTAGADNLQGSAYDDNLFGYDGADVISGHFGDDALIGGTGNDTLDGQTGNDTYIWSRGDGDDRISDSSADLSEVDTLRLTDVASGDVTLTRANGSNDLVITVAGTGGATLTVVSQYYVPWPSLAHQGHGLERIEFSDGVAWTLDDIFAATQLIGTTGADNLQGTVYDDNILGADGADVLSGSNGDDQLTGGAGNDTLQGQVGSDTYTWSRGDGDDRIQDGSGALTEIDTLVLTDVASSEVTLTRVNGSNDLTITITGTGGATLTVVSQYYTLHPWYAEYGYGLEQIEFSDGVVWTLDDILAATQVNGAAGADNLQGSIYDDNLFGEDGADVLTGSNGDDQLTGDAGNDTLTGGTGSDSFIFADGYGQDTINDFDPSKVGEVLDLRGVSSIASFADLIANHASEVGTSVVIDEGGGNTITLLNTSLSDLTENNVLTFDALAYIASHPDLLAAFGANEIAGTSHYFNHGIAEGRTVTFDAAQYLTNYSDLQVLYGNDYAAATAHYINHGFAEGRNPSTDPLLVGSASHDTISGRTIDDSIIGNAGNDILSGLEGDDTLEGGDGVDVLYGGYGNDHLIAGSAATGAWQVLQGQAGDDTYWLDSSGGWTTLGYEADNGGNDRVVFTDLNLSDFSSIVQHPNPSMTESIIFNGPSGLTVHVHGIAFTTGGATNFETYEFADGTEINAFDFGGAGADTLSGGSSNDYFDGGAGSDVFVFADNYGDDVINGFDATDDAEDIDLSGIASIASFADLTSVMTQEGSDVVIDTGTGTITLLGVNLADLHEQDFVF